MGAVRWGPGKQEKGEERCGRAQGAQGGGWGGRKATAGSRSVLRAPQRASGASSGKRDTASAPPRAAPRNSRRRDAEARGPSRARVPAPRCVWVDPQTEPFEGRGKTKRTSIVSMILRVIQRDQRSWMRARRRHKPSPPLINLSTIERKHNSTSCALWSLPQIFLTPVADDQNNWKSHEALFRVAFPKFQWKFLGGGGGGILKKPIDQNHKS